MKRVTIHEAKTHLSRLLAAVERGEEVIVQRATQPVARIIPYRDASDPVPERRRCFGIDDSGWRVPDDFDEPLPEDVLRSFE